MKNILVCLFILLSFGLKAQNEIKVWVDGSCETCKERIEKASMQIMGVNKATWDVSTQMLSLDTDENFYQDDLLTHLSSVGYDTKDYLGDPLATDNYSFCCKYIELKNVQR